VGYEPTNIVGSIMVPRYDKTKFTHLVAIVVHVVVRLVPANTPLIKRMKGNYFRNYLIFDAPTTEIPFVLSCAKFPPTTALSSNASRKALTLAQST
jgi:hypothetical protein